MIKNNITKNWFFKTSDFWDTEILEIEKNLKIAIFDDSENIKKIILKENCFLEYFSFFSWEKNIEKNIIISEKNSCVEIKNFLISGNNEILKAKISWEIEASNSKINSQIISIAKENGKIDLDWIVKIWKNIEKIEWYLKEENIFLWEKAKISWIPTLLVRSDDVKANHSCSIEKISDSKLFYLRSRWIWKNNALQIMIEWYIYDLFKCLNMIDKDFYKKLVWKIKKQLI